MIDEEIWDGYDDPGELGIVNYQPFLTFASDQTPGQIIQYDNIRCYTDNTYQMLLGDNINLDRRFFIEMTVVDGNENSVDMSAVRVENIRNGDYIGPLVVETSLNSGIFRGSAVTGDTTNFVFDSLRVIHGDTIRISPFNFPDLFTTIVVDTTLTYYIVGDANSDGEVNVLDVVDLISYILNQIIELDFFAADINEDSYLDVLDVIGIINIILGNDINRGPSTTHDLIVEFGSPQISTNNNFIVPIDLQSMESEISGIEIDFELTNSAFNSIEIPSGDTDYYCNEITPGIYKCIIIDMRDNILDSQGKLQLIIGLMSNNSEIVQFKIKDLIVCDSNLNQYSSTYPTEPLLLSEIPHKFVIGDNFPNPFNPVTTIPFSLPYNTSIQIDIFNIHGDQIKRLSEQNLFEAGYHEIMWDGSDFNNVQVASGIYIIKFNSQEFNISKKMTLLK